MSLVCPHFGVLKGLEKLSVLGIAGEECVEISTLISNSPGLLHLNVVGLMPVDGEGFAEHPDIFPVVSSTPRMRLQSLGLTWFNMSQSIGSSILPHLQLLESLQLQLHVQSFRGWDEIGGSLSGPTHGIWKLLCGSGINLKHIDVDKVDGTMLDYLTSSSGMETLRITSWSESEDGFSEDLAYRFFTSILPRHSKSLRSLSILVPSSNPWCFRAGYSNSLSPCKALDSLSLSVEVGYPGNTPKNVSDIVSSKI